MSIDKVTELTESCLIPTLKVNIGDQLISAESFKEIQPALQNNLRQLLDTFHAHKTELLENDVNTCEFRKLFILVLCEQSANNTVFQVQDSKIVDAIQDLYQQLVKKICQADSQLLSGVMDNFTQKLNKDVWKRNLGAMYGFQQFCLTCYCDDNAIPLNSNEAQFILSRALCFADHFEPELKIIALQLFNVLLNKKQIEVVKLMNVHLVIHKEVLTMVEKAKETNFIEKLWNCLYNCLYIEEGDKTNFKSWSQFDTTFKKLTERVGFEDNKLHTILYLNILNRFILMGRKETIEGEFEVVVEELRKIKHPNYRMFRWVKRLFELYQNEAYKLGGSSDSVVQYLQVSDLT